MSTAYRVFRKGFNAANNPSLGARSEDCVRHVATVEADDEDGAVRAALAQGVTVYDGQAVWAEPEEDCLEKEAAEAEAHEGQVLVKYWQGTTAVSSWCQTQEELDNCLDLHQNSRPARFFHADGRELDYELAVFTVGGSLHEEE